MHYKISFRAKLVKRKPLTSFAYFHITPGFMNPEQSDYFVCKQIWRAGILGFLIAKETAYNRCIFFYKKNYTVQQRKLSSLHRNVPIYQVFVLPLKNDTFRKKIGP